MIVRRRDRALTVQMLVHAVVLVFACGTEIATGAQSEVIHRRAWLESIDSSSAHPAARYGYYAYRSLAVEHPEVYLLADKLVTQALTDLPGGRLAYRSKDVRDVEMYLRIARRETKGGSFNWGVAAAVPDSTYDTRTKRSSFDWLDMRAPSVAVLLKSATSRLTTLESAILRYSQFAEPRANDIENLYIVVDRDGAGYLAADSSLWRAGLTGMPVADWKSVSPILVFSRYAVFSVITGRDDRERAPSLGVLLGRLGKPAKIDFDSEDKRTVDGLKRASAMEDSSALRLAALVASGLVDLGQPRIDSAWSQALNNGQGSLPCAPLLLEEAFFWGNRLSPVTASLAAEFDGQDIPSALADIQSRYLAMAGRRVSKDDATDSLVEAWGCIWSYDLLQTIIDDNIRTRAGSSNSQASAMSAVLDLAGIEHFQLAVRKGDLQIPNQEWLIAGNGRYQFNLGVWTTLPDTPPQATRPPNLLISGFTLRGLSVRMTNGRFCSQLDYLTVAQQFSRITRQVPFATISVADPSGEVATLQKFMLDLAADRFELMPTSWPDSLR